MSHKHFCDYAGHEWECDGSALRPLTGQTEPTICVCLDCQVPMEQGDHGECAIELLACPAHREDQLRDMGFVPEDPSAPEDRAEDRMFRDKDGNPTIGFCLWCGQEFYAVEEMEAHNAGGMAGCEAYQSFIKNAQPQ